MKIGDVVTLKSGGPMMTVTNILTDVEVECTWFGDGSHTHAARFPKAALKQQTGGKDEQGVQAKKG